MKHCMDGSVEPLFVGMKWARKFQSVELIDETVEKVKLIRGRLKTAQDRQKSYGNTKRRELEFEVDDRVF